MNTTALTILLTLFLTTFSGCGKTKYEYIVGEKGEAGAQGETGATGANGADGTNGTSCAVTQETNGAIVTCGDESVFVANGADGENGADASAVLEICPSGFSTAGKATVPIFGDHVIVIYPGNTSSAPVRMCVL